jgi:hypothetical protein
VKARLICRVYSGSIWGISLIAGCWMVVTYYKKHGHRILVSIFLAYSCSNSHNQHPATSIYSSKCTTSPLLSLGSNHVVFGGMMFPESAMSISCFIETG